MAYYLYCFHCSYRTKLKGNLRRHMGTWHLNARPVTPKSEYRCCLCALYTAHKRDDMIRHYVDTHDVMVESAFYDFESVLLFKRWKAELEKKEVSSYTVICSRTKKGTKTIFYRCHRDGFYVPKGQGARHTKIKGTNKINGCCPASMTANVYADGKVKVKFNVTHVGHDKDVGRLRLDKQERESIAAKLRQKVPFKTVLKVIRNDADNQNVNRFHLTNAQDLKNIVRDFNLGDQYLRQKDRVSVASWVMKMQKSSSLVRSNKSQGELTTAYTKFLKEEDYIEENVCRLQAQKEDVQQEDDNWVCSENDSKMSKQELVIKEIFPISKDFNSTDSECPNLMKEKVEEMMRRIVSQCSSSDDYKLVMRGCRSMLHTLKSQKDSEVGEFPEKATVHANKNVTPQKRFVSVKKPPAKDAKRIGLPSTDEQEKKSDRLFRQD